VTPGGSEFNIERYGVWKWGTYGELPSNIWPANNTENNDHDECLHLLFSQQPTHIYGYSEITLVWWSWIILLCVPPLMWEKHIFKAATTFSCRVAKIGTEDVPLARSPLWLVGIFATRMGMAGCNHHRSGEERLFKTRKWSSVIVKNAKMVSSNHGWDWGSTSIASMVIKETVPYPVHDFRPIIYERWKNKRNGRKWSNIGLTCFYSCAHDS
jgi:hypothetical protein